MNRLMLENQIDLYLTDIDNVKIESNAVFTQYEIDFEHLIEHLKDIGFEDVSQREVLDFVTKRLNNPKEFFKYEQQ